MANLFSAWPAVRVSDLLTMPPRATALFNWWSSTQVEFPFYGGYLSALALHGVDQIIATDDGTSRYGQYVLFKKGEPVKVVIVNTEYYSGTGARSTTDFVIKSALTASGKKGRENPHAAATKGPRVLRATAGSSDVTATTAKQGGAAHAGATIGGQSFSDDTCAIVGGPVFESPTVDAATGATIVSVGASEAVIVYL